MFIVLHFIHNMFRTLMSGNPSSTATSVSTEKNIHVNCLFFMLDMLTPDCAILDLLYVLI